MCVDAILLSCPSDYATMQRLFERITEQLQSTQSTRVFLAFVPLINKSLEVSFNFEIVYVKMEKSFETALYM